jgi:phospholipase C
VNDRLTRRQLLAAGGAAVAGAGLAGALWHPWDSGSGGSTPIAATSPLGGGAGRLEDIEHVVVVLQENRSFDHYFGMFPGVNGYGDRSARHLFEQGGYDAPGHDGTLLPWHLTTGGGPRCIADITHDWGPQHGSWNGGRMNRWVREHLAVDGRAAGVETMGYFDRADLSTYYAMAEAFTICDAYHASVIGPSVPNHLYLFSGTLDPDGRAGGPMVEDPAPLGRPVGKYLWKTVPEALREAGVSWKIYVSQNRSQLENVMSLFRVFNEDEELSRLGLQQRYPRDFYADVQAGTLPSVSWVLGALNESEHPSFSTAKAGESTSHRVVTELMKHPDLWARTAVFLTWDENGGFFDHVVPPTPPPGTEGEYLTTQVLPPAALGVRGPIGLGFRVPLIIASPFSRGGFVCSDTFDHTSILRFVERRFGAQMPNISAWRRETVGDLTSAFNFARPDASVPDLPPGENPEDLHEGDCRTPVESIPPPNRMPVQEAGTARRPSGLVGAS